MELSNELKKVRYIVVDENHVSQRIDNFLFTELKKIPKGMIYKKIRKGEVRVNSKRIKPTYKLQLNDNVRIPPLRYDDEKILNPDAQLIKVIEQAVIFENEHFLLLNKPAGLAVHKGTNNNIGVIEVLKSGDRPYVELVHRIDRATSGCLLVAKNRVSLLALQEELKQGRFKKQYLALTYGRWQNKETNVCKAIGQLRKRNAEKFMVITSEGKYAESIFKLNTAYKNWSLMDVTIKTGRTHQIRVHAKSEGHALAGDEKYMTDKVQMAAKKQGIHKLCLHAKSLAFTLDKDYAFTIPLPEVFKNHLTKLKT